MKITCSKATEGYYLAAYARSMIKGTIREYSVIYQPAPFSLFKRRFYEMIGDKLLALNFQDPPSMVVFT